MTNEDRKVSSAKDWKKSSSGLGLIHEVSVPSGNVARLRRPGMDTFIKLGMIPNSMMSIIQRNITKAQRGQEPDEASVAAELAKLIEDPEKIADILGLADKVLCYCAVEPKVSMPPDDPDERDNDVLYADEVDMDDKMFIFSWAVGGAEDLASFRSGQAAGVGAVPPGADVADEA